MRTIRFGLLLTILALLVGSPGRAQDRIEQFANARGGTQRYLVTLPPGPVDGIAILLVGGAGRIGLDRGAAGLPDDFLTRARHHLAGRGFVVVLSDAPSERGTDGLAGWRLSAGHMADIGALARRLRARWPVPVWLIGAGRGAVSALAGGARVPEIAGIVLVAAASQPGKRLRATVFDAPVREIGVPALVIHHKDDACPVSPPAGAGLLFARLSASRVREIRFIEGGKPAASDPCGPRSPHGFHGAERKAVRVIVKWFGIFER